MTDPNPSHDSEDELLVDGQEEVFSRTEVEVGRIEHGTGRDALGRRHSPVGPVVPRPAAPTTERVGRPSGQARRTLDALYTVAAVAAKRLIEPNQRTLAHRLAHDRLCREATRLSQLSEDVVQPWAIGHVRRAAVDAAMIEWDLIRVLTLEMLEADDHSFLQASLTHALSEALDRRRTAECGPEGLVAAMVAGGCPDDRLAETLQAHADDLDDRYRREGWSALQPQGLETLRSAIAPRSPARRCDLHMPSS